MDFGLVGLNSLACSNSVSNNSSFFASENGAECNKQKWRGSEFLKQERRVNAEGYFREFKVAKISSFDDTMLKVPSQRSNSTTEVHQQMLSFSSPTSQTMALPYFHSTSSGFSRNTGNDSAAGMHGVVSGVRGPFTPSQWMELEHQALIYKYIIANVPIPSYLLNPIRKALESAGFSGLRHNASGWSGFHLGFSNTDPEPGRCRRTDGKKWRCSRDAVPDQKYCERHLNRGRHRSRKPVEGHPASRITTSNAKLPPVASSKLPSAGGDSKNTGLSRHQLNNLQRSPSDTLSGMPNINRSLSKKPNLDEGYQNNTFLHETSSKISPEFGLVCSDSLLNPLNRSSSLVNCRSYTASDNPSDNENKSNHPLRQFMDDWPKNKERSIISWPEVDLHPERTHLSISIPIETSDFMSSTTSTGEQLTISPLGMCTNTNNQGQRQTSWIPVSWEPSMGGPLGEVLHTTSNGTGECNTAMALNLIDRWDNSPRLASSPTGVLQRCAFGSLSNSSAGSSPKAESSKTLDGASFYNGINGSSLMHSSLPAL